MFEPGDDVLITMASKPWGFGVVIQQRGGNVWTRIKLTRDDGYKRMAIMPFSPKQLIRRKNVFVQED